MDSIGKVFESRFARFKNFILIGDFNAEESDTTIKDFYDIYSCKNLIKDAKCFKNPDQPKCIDLTLTNRKRSFQNSCVIDTGLSDFHKMTVTVLRSHLHKLGKSFTTSSKIIQPKSFTSGTIKNFQMMHLRLSFL